MQALEIGSDKPAKSWCFWSTTESIQNDVPSLTAIIETLIAVPLYWWIALQVGMLPSLLIAAATAPLVLLRSEESVALGLKWLLAYHDRSISTNYNQLSLNQRRTLWGIGLVAIVLSSFLAFNLTYDYMDFIGPPLWTRGIKISIGVILLASVAVFLFNVILILVSPLLFLNPSSIIMTNMTPDSKLGRTLRILAIPVSVLGMCVGLLIFTTVIRVATTLVNIRSGIRALPQNFRRLTVCTSPAQVPEIIPGIESTDSGLRFSEVFGDVFGSLLDFERYLVVCGLLLGGFFLYFPAWIYRLTIKSTAWFWWPLAFLGGELRQARNPDLLNPDLLRWRLMGSLWAKTSIALACSSLLAFAIANLVLSGAVFEQNPLLSPLGYLLLIDWTPRFWQICALAGSALSLALVFMLDHVAGEYRIAQASADLETIRAAERRFGWIERLSRLRFVLFIIFWLMVGTQALLYFNSQRCWFSLSPKLQDWAKILYGDYLPSDRCLDRIPKVSL